jgi:hypothetical protein
MLAKLRTFALQGIDAAPVEAEVDAAPGMPKIIMMWTILPMTMNLRKDCRLQQE